ncbi:MULTISPECIES: DUF4352 domain-containing protein [unclassified Nocardiopsis]|uniref:DUF4352 domain-containing protein n=1 Tax=Nocardiopsis TaxID=2013 RepID=UPI00387A9F44
MEAVRERRMCEHVRAPTDPHPPEHPMTHQPQPGQAPYGVPGPHPQPRTGMSAGAKFGVGCAVLFCLLFAFVGCAALLASGAPQDSDRPAATGGESAPEAEEVPAGEEAEAPAEEAAADAPVVLTATRHEFAPSILHDGGDYTSVYVTVENRGDEDVDVNPLYFSVVAEDGTKKDTIDGLGMAEDQIDTLTLSPGQRAEGVITVKGSIAPASVEFSGAFGLGDTYTAEVG